MNHMDISLLIFTHSSANDYFFASFDRVKKYFPNIPIYITSNTPDLGNMCIDSCTNFIEYDTQWSWSQKVCYALEQIDTQYVFLLISNNFFIDEFSHSTLHQYVELMKLHKIDQLRMNNSGTDIFSESTLQKNFNPSNIYRIENTSYYFSVQPAIWNRLSLMNILLKYIHIDYREIELAVSEYTRQFTNYFVFTPNDVKNFSYGCPLIHALTYGKWVLDSPLFIKEIEQISKEYNINLTNRQ